MVKNWLPLDFLVRSKNYTFSETLDNYKKTDHSVQVFFAHFVDFQGQNIIKSHSTVSPKYQLFENVTYYISIER